MDKYISLEKHIENIPGFELTPDVNIVKDVLKVCEMAKIKLKVMEDNFFENGKAIKKLLDDRRRLTKLCLAMYRILFYSHENNAEIFETEVWQILREATGKTIDVLLKLDE